jgi:aldehyde:ferredoxin oxidoreductase
MLLFVKGIVQKPVFIKIVDENYSIEDASNLWGKDASSRSRGSPARAR